MTMLSYTSQTRATQPRHADRQPRAMAATLTAQTTNLRTLWLCLLALIVATLSATAQAEVYYSVSSAFSLDTRTSTPPPPTLPTLQIANASATEGSIVVFPVTLSQSSASNVSVNYATSSGSAVQGTDFVAASGTLNIPAGQTTAAINVQTLTDNLYEGTETFTVTLSNAQNASIGTATATGTILDANAMPALTVADITVAAGAPASFTVQMNRASVLTTSVNFAITGSSVLSTGASGTLNIAAGQTSGSIAVPLASNASGSFTLTLSNVKNGTLARSSATGTITAVVERPKLYVNDITATKNSTAIFTISMDKASALPVAVQVTTTHQGTNGVAGTDYVYTYGEVGIPAGQTSATFSVVIRNNAGALEDRTFKVWLQTADNADIADAIGICTILYEPQAAPVLPGLSIADKSAAEGAGKIDLTLTLSAATTTSVSVTYATVNGTAVAGADYVATSGTVLIPAGQTSAIISVQLINDAIYELDESFTVVLSNAVNATITRAQATATILNDDPAPSLSIASISVGQTDQQARFTVTASAVSGVNATVAYATADGTAKAGVDYQATNGTLTIPAGQTSGTITVPLLNTVAHSSEKSFGISLTNATHASIATAQATATLPGNPAADARNVVYSLRVRGTRHSTSSTPLVGDGYLVLDLNDQQVTSTIRWSDGSSQRTRWDANGTWFSAATGTDTFWFLSAGVHGAKDPNGRVADFSYAQLFGRLSRQPVSIGHDSHVVAATLGGTLRNGQTVSDARYDVASLDARIELARSRSANLEQVGHHALVQALELEMGITPAAAPSSVPSLMPVINLPQSEGIVCYSLRMQGIEAGNNRVRQTVHGGYLLVDLTTGQTSAIFGAQDQSGAWYRVSDWTASGHTYYQVLIGRQPFLLLGGAEQPSQAGDGQQFRIMHGAALKANLGGATSQAVAVTLTGEYWQHLPGSDNASGFFMQGTIQATALGPLTLSINRQGLSLSEAADRLELTLPAAFQKRAN